MEGFFKQIEKKTKTKNKTTSKQGCGSCGLYKVCNSPKMQPTGEGKESILIIENESIQKMAVNDKPIEYGKIQHQMDNRVRLHLFDQGFRQSILW